MPIAKEEEEEEIPLDRGLPTPRRCGIVQRRAILTATYTRGRQRNHERREQRGSLVGRRVADGTGRMNDSEPGRCRRPAMPPLNVETRVRLRVSRKITPPRVLCR